MEPLEYQGEQIVVGQAGESYMGGPADAARLIEACFEHGASRLLLYPENLSPQFFDLSSGDAGEVLQKLRNYRIRLAILRTPALRLSSRFGELLADEAEGSYFRLFDGREEALAWLAQT
ncbi:DUF4180 domain-containing protein [Chloroflexia bacterium SDU3-3]|nr:DUF4180 domain-containing protein [Chloroflexia bacterium SDU3-3]